MGLFIKPLTRFFNCMKINRKYPLDNYIIFQVINDLKQKTPLKRIVKNMLKP